jgi:hypothetical protein
MTKYTDPTYRIAVNAFTRDRHGNEYSGDALMVALLIHTTGKGRSLDNEREVARLLDDPNIEPRKKRR